MAKKTPEDFGINPPESSGWNVAMDYSQQKIMNPLRLLDYYETIATFGTADIYEEFMIAEENKNLAKLHAIKRFHFVLTQLISNSINIIKSKEQKAKIQIYKEDLDKYKAMFKKGIIESSKVLLQPKPHKVVIINQEAFDYLLGQLSELKHQIIEPLYKSGIIFPYEEEYSPEQWKAYHKNALSTEA